MKRTQKQAHELSLLEFLQAMRVSDEAACSLFVVHLTNDQSLSQGRCDDARQMGASGRVPWGRISAPTIPSRST